MFSKQAQAHTQIFVYILSIVIVAVILLFGYNAIRNFGAKADQVSYIKLKTDLESIVREIGPDYGSIKRQEFAIGGDYKEICFVDSDVVDGTIYEKDPDYVFDSQNKLHPLIKDMVDSNTGKNTFLMAETLKESFNVGKIKADYGYVCIQSSRGRVRIEFEGLGDRTQIRAWPLS